MNTNRTWLWVFTAAVLFAGILAYHRFAPKPDNGPKPVLPGLSASAIHSVEILPADQPAIRAERTNGIWQLIEPAPYPARGTNIETLLTALENSIPALHLSSQDLKSAKESSEDFGFNPPRATVILQPGDQHIQFGNKTAPGDQVFVKIVGVDGMFVLDAGLFQLIPRSQDDWRETSLVDFSTLAFDRLVVSNGAKALELKLNPTNQLWRMVLPWDARADGAKVMQALQKLATLRALKFLPLGPKTDLDSFGLQTPDLILNFKNGTNCALCLVFGKSPTNDTAVVYARRNEEGVVVITAKEAIEPWRASYETFRDRHLLTAPAQPAEIEIHARENFTLVRTNNSWLITPQNLAADAELVNDLITNLNTLQVVQFVKDVVVPPDLPQMGLAAPPYQILLRGASTNASVVTNSLIAEIDFGTNQNDTVLARRTDESSVYAVRLADFQRLPQTAIQFRERRIWHFTENEIASIKVRQNGKVFQVNRSGTNQWSLAPGSQGMINNFAIEETGHRLGELFADAWVERGDQNFARYGIKPEGHRISVELKDGETMSVDLGNEASIGSPYAAVTIGSEPWVFELSPVLYQFVQLYLTIPSEVP